MATIRSIDTGKIATLASQAATSLDCLYLSSVDGRARADDWRRCQDTFRNLVAQLGEEPDDEFNMADASGNALATGGLRILWSEVQHIWRVSPRLSMRHPPEPLPRCATLQGRSPGARLQGLAEQLERWLQSPTDAPPIGSASPATKESPADSVGEIPQHKQGGRTRTRRGLAPVKIAHALSEHHQFDGDACGSTVSIGVNALAGVAKVSPGSVTRFFNTRIGGHDGKNGHDRYCAACARGIMELIGTLKALSVDPVVQAT